MQSISDSDNSNSELFSSKRQVSIIAEIVSQLTGATCATKTSEFSKISQYFAYHQNIGGDWFVSLIDEPPFGAQEFLGKFEHVRWSGLLHNPGD